MKTQKMIFTALSSITMVIGLMLSTQAKAGEVQSSANTICQCVDKGGGANCGAIQSTTSSGPSQQTGH